VDTDVSDEHAALHELPEEKEYFFSSNDKPVTSFQS
jgi:hypothetical protein